MVFDSYGINGNIHIQDTDVEKETKTDSISKKRKDLEEMAFEALDIVIDEILLTSNESEVNKKKVVLDKVNEVINKILIDSKRNLSLGDRKKVTNLVMDEIFGYGPITVLLNDSTVTEVMVNGPDNIYVFSVFSIFPLRST